MIAASIFSSCYKKPDFSNTPVITLEAANMTHISKGNDSVTFTISYKDGDGDIGFTGQGDTLYPFNGNNYFNHDMFVYYERFQNGSFVPALGDTLTGHGSDSIIFPFRLPNFNDSKKPQPIQGEITFGITLQDLSYFNPVRFRIFLYDRALHQSNILISPTFVRKLN